MNIVRLHFEIAQTRDTLKVKFRTPERAYDFQVDVMRLQKSADEIRNTLTEICLDYVLKKPGERSCEGANPELLQNLAMQGDVMRSVFFSAQPELVDILRKEYRDSSITFDLAKRVKCYAPWGLMFDVPECPDKPGMRVPFKELTDAQLRQGFWCMNHRVSVLYSVSDGPVSSEDPEEKAEGSKLLAVLHSDALNYADPDRRIKWSNEFDSLIDFLRYLREHQNEEWILYFFCHAKENILFVRSRNSRNEDKLTPESLMNYLEGQSQIRKRGMVFLNGCKTGVSKRQHSWQLATRYRGLAGYIGTEAIVPTRFAWGFGNDLLYLLASGETPETAMNELRERHWPLSLLYGEYCVPDGSVTSMPFATSFPKPSRINHCSLTLLDSRDDSHATLPFLPPRD